MMARTVALCLDEDSQRHPEYLGLEGESFDHQDWLEVYDSGAQARSCLHERQGVSEVWVVSSNDIEPINLAASIKHDRPDMRIKLVAVTADGSLRSRATNASIDEVLELAAFVRLYSEAKLRAQSSVVTAPPAPQTPQTSEVPQPPLKPHLNLPDPRDNAAISNSDIDPESIDKVIEPHRLFESQCAETADQILGSEEDDELPAAAMSPIQAPVHDLQNPILRQHKGFLLSVVSGSGGSGKSTIAILAALSAAHKGYRTLLLDCDLQFGDVAYVLRKIPSVPVDEVLNDPAEKNRVFIQKAPLVVIGAPDRFEVSESIGDAVAGLIEEATAHFDVIVVNTGSNWSEQHAMLLEKSSVALFLLDQRSSSLRATSHALDLCNRCNIASVPFKFAINRCNKNAPFGVHEIASIFPDLHAFELKDGGIEVEEFFASGNAFELRERGNELVASIDNLLAQLLPLLDAGDPQGQDIPEQLPSKRRRGFRMNKKHSRAAL